jgi:hypothetical protein
MSILSALKQNNSSIDDLAKLPQAMIMQMAQKKQISQDMLAPILSRKAEMMDAVARSKSLQPQPPVPTVMEQVMQKNLQAENPQPEPMAAPMASPQGSAIPTVPDDAGIAQLPVPERQYAGGGIIAFAKGDLIDLDEDESEEDLIAEYAAAMQAGEMAMARGDNTGVGIRQSMPQGGESGLRDSGSLRDRLHGIVIKKESGGKRYDKEGNLLTSSKGALGERQVMPATIKDPGFGIKAARNDSPDEIARVGEEYLDVMLNRYKDPKLAMIAYNMGPTATDKWLMAGADINKLPKETRGYIAGVNLAGGGEVRHFVNAGYVDPMGMYGAGDYDMDTLRIEEIQAAKKRKADAEKIEFLRESAPELLAKTNPPVANAPKKAAIPQTGLTAAQLDEIALGQGVFPEGSPALPSALSLDPRQDAAPQVSPKAAEESYFDKIIKQIGSDRADLAKQKADDRNMAMLAAGLGMMGGESPYAFTNIGKGGLSGVQYLSEANKQRAAEKAALDKTQLMAQRYKDLGDTAKGQQSGLLALRAQELDVKRGELSEKERAHNLSAIGKLESNAQAKAMAALKSQGLIGMDLTDPNTMQLISEWTNRELANSKAYNKLYQQTYGMPFDVAPTVTAGNVMKFDKKGNPIK